MGHINSLTLYNMIISSFISILCYGFVFLFISCNSFHVGDSIISFRVPIIFVLAYLCRNFPFFSGWASRVYYSDNGSTVIEIALKMAFRKFCLDHGIMSGSENSTRNERNIQLKVCYGHTKHPCLPYLIID